MSDYFNNCFLVCLPACLPVCLSARLVVCSHDRVCLCLLVCLLVFVLFWTDADTKLNRGKVRRPCVNNGDSEGRRSAAVFSVSLTRKGESVDVISVGL